MIRKLIRDSTSYISSLVSGSGVGGGSRGSNWRSVKDLCGAAMMSILGLLHSRWFFFVPCGDVIGGAFVCTVGVALGRFGGLWWGAIDFPMMGIPSI